MSHRVFGRSLFLPLLIFVMLSAARTALAGPEPLPRATPLPAISGMALIEGSSFFVVMDTKANNPDVRAGIITVSDQGAVSFIPLVVEWPECPANDLESACPIPGHPGEFFAAESGSWTDRDSGEFHPGRIFHLTLSSTDGVWTASVLGTLPIPEEYHEIEGMVALYGSDSVWSAPANPQSNSGYDNAYRDQTRQPQVNYMQQELKAPDGARVFTSDLPPVTEPPLLIVLGLRGGTFPYEPPILHWGHSDLAAGMLDFQDGGGLPLEHFTSSNMKTRGCSDLYLDPAGVLWVAGADDIGDAGPFRSTIWRFGPFMPDRLSFFDHYFYIDQINHGSLQWTMDGIKIEALAAPVLNGSVLSYATDDENYGGIWRPLDPATGAFD
jgi:hypothetical protein